MATNAAARGQTVRRGTRSRTTSETKYVLFDE